MSRIRFRAAALVATVVLTACSGLKDALTAHVDTVARAGGQELTVQHLSQMMATANAPARKDVAVAIANIWVNYQLLGDAAAHGDSLTDPKVVNDAMWAQIAQIKLKKLFAAVGKTAAAPDPATFEKHYNDGDMLAARHILFMAKKVGGKPGEREAAEKQANAIAKQVNAGNFAAMAKKYSQDPGSKDQGGDLGVFQKGQMVPEFQAGVLALKPGEISKPIASDFGYHIIMRETWADAKDKFSKAYAGIAQQAAESVYNANLEKAANIVVKPDAGKTIRAIAADMDSYRDDRTVVATAKHVDLTGAKVAKWMAAYPAQMRIREQLQQLPDSMMGLFAKQLVVNELMLQAADSAKMDVDSTEKANIRQMFTTSVQTAFTGLNVSPASLADSAKSESAREKLAATRIDAFMANLLANKAQFVDVSEPVSSALRAKYEARVIPAGIERAVADAQKAAVKADSAKAKNMPSSAVPAPTAPPQGAPTPAPAGATPPASKTP